VLRRREVGEKFTVTVVGSPVVGPGPAAKRRWVDSETLKDLCNTPTPESFAEDLERFPAGLADPLR
jgi:hypothetical protein